MLIDTHCHLYLDRFREDIGEVCGRAAGAGVRHIFMPAINFGSLEEMGRLRDDRITFHKMAGIHPNEINDGLTVTEDELFEQCGAEDIVAVGETGLDYYWSTDFKTTQQEMLVLHCRVARTLGKPVILHNRDSTADLLDIIEKEQDGSLTGIWHCFNGTADEGKKALDLGLHLGIGGVLTFKNAGVDQSVAKLPLEKMVLETDAPYLAPEPERGKRNEPSFIRYTARKLAEVKGRSLEDIEKYTAGTALKLFGIT